MTTTTTPQPRRTGWRVAGYLARRATLLEIHGYQSTYRFLFRRPRVPPGATGFSYHRPVLEILIVFVVVSAVELVVVDFVVHRWWPQMRIPLLVLGCWGPHPHVRDPVRDAYPSARRRTRRHPRPVRCGDRHPAVLERHLLGDTSQGDGGRKATASDRRR